MNRAELLRGLEALLFVSDEPVAAVAIAQALEIERREAEELCGELARGYEERDAGIVVRNVAGGWRLATHPDAAAIVERYVVSARHGRLTKAALETLAIVAYKQPVTRHQVSSIRGVNSDGVIRALTDRGLVAEVGRDDRPGRPVLYGTTPEFLERLGLPSLSALPPLAPLLGNGDGAALSALDDADDDVAAADAGTVDDERDVVAVDDDADVVALDDGADAGTSNDGAERD